MGRIYIAWYLVGRAKGLFQQLVELGVCEVERFLHFFASHAAAADELAEDVAAGDL